MKRELKFRCWNGEQMISPDYICRAGQAHWKENSIPTASWEVMQFTGLLDSKGVEIYEGDVVDGFDGEFKAQVKWGNEDGAWVIDDLAKNAGAMLGEQYAENFEVIGNIHENPELL